jgi:hypothetical protein
MKRLAFLRCLDESFRRDPLPKTHGELATKKAARSKIAKNALTGEARIEAARKLSTDCFGVPGHTDELLKIVSMSGQMRTGAGVYGRGATRRDKLVAVGKAARRLAHHMGQIDVWTRAEIFGVPKTPETAVDFTEEVRAAMPDLPAAPVYAATAGSAVHHFEMLINLVDLLARNVDRVSAKQPRDNAGAPPVSDATVFAIEALEGLWTRVRGARPANASRKRAGFGFLVEGALALEPIFSREEVRTALRRYIEVRKAR